MKCSNCGASLKPTAKICIGCGSPVASQTQVGIGRGTPTSPEPKGSSSNDKIEARPIAAMTVAPVSQSVEQKTLRTSSEPSEAANPSSSVPGPIIEASSGPTYETATDEIYIKDRANVAPHRSTTPVSTAFPPQEVTNKLIFAGLRILISIVKGKLIFAGLVVVIAIGIIIAIVFRSKEQANTSPQVNSAAMSTTQSSASGAPPAATTPPPAAVVSLPASPSETNPSDGSLGPVQAVDAAVVTKDALNQLLQLAAGNNWDGIDMMVRRLKGVAYERGDRKVARELNKNALNLMAKNEFAMAAIELAKAIAADPSDIEILNNLGYAELKLKKFDTAVAHLLDTLLIDPTRAAGWLNVSEAFAERDKAPAAQASLKLAFHFSRDQTKASTYLAGDESVIPSQKFRAIILQLQPEFASVPQFGR